jgi:hypothetical protein
VIGFDELPDGYAFRLPGDGKWTAVVTELIVTEQECCPFLTFELAAHPMEYAGKAESLELVVVTSAHSKL